MKRSLVHPLIQTARGHVVDQDWLAAERTLSRAVDVAKDLEAEVERLRAERGYALRDAELARARADANHAEVERLRKTAEARETA